MKSDKTRKAKGLNKLPIKIIKILNSASENFDNFSIPINKTNDAGRNSQGKVTK